MDFILDLIGRSEELFGADVERSERELSEMVRGSRFLAIGGAGMRRSLEVPVSTAPLRALFGHS